MQYRCGKFWSRRGRSPESLGFPHFCRQRKTPSTAPFTLSQLGNGDALDAYRNRSQGQSCLLGLRCRAYSGHVAPAARQDLPIRRIMSRSLGKVFSVESVGHGRRAP